MINPEDLTPFRLPSVLEAVLEAPFPPPVLEAVADHFPPPVSETVPDHLPAPVLEAVPDPFRRRRCWKRFRTPSRRLVRFECLECFHQW